MCMQAKHHGRLEVMASQLSLDCCLPPASVRKEELPPMIEVVFRVALWHEMIK